MTQLNPNGPWWIAGGGSIFESFTSRHQIRKPAGIYVTLDERSDISTMLLFASI